MEEKVDIVRERAKERLASMDREALGEKSIEEVKNIYNQFVAEEQAKENNIREMAQEKLAQVDESVLNEMSIEAVKDKYNEIKEEVRQDFLVDNGKLNDIELPSVKKVGDNILSQNQSLSEVKLESIEEYAERKRKESLNDMFKESPQVETNDNTKTK